ncbi:MAG: ABC transporter ATP-binding protein [Spirochaetia bacterium]|jgi:iron(III) transport system ATP-binding protein|nr:ABC transporter ATP-binding protein [Spirochaetia bacterium]
MSLEIDDVSVTYDTQLAVDKFSAKIKNRELIAILGPSGCGKTSLLRAVAGIGKTVTGEIILDGRVLFSSKRHISIVPNDRNIGFVFQNYALWPHMTIMQNIAYPLKCKKKSVAEIEKSVKDCLELFHLTHKGLAYPEELSGGEQQRVSLARAIVMEPQLLLMDEPLSNLDAKLRIQMRSQIFTIQRKFGIACLYVTHDQQEALSIADRIIVMDRGRIKQIGTPEEIYNFPQSMFVADFIGQANLIHLTVQQAEGNIITVLLPGNIPFRIDRQDCRSLKKGEPVALMLRPEYIAIGKVKVGKPRARIVSKQFLGSYIRYELEISISMTIYVHVPFASSCRNLVLGTMVSYVPDTRFARIIPR